MILSQYSGLYTGWCMSSRVEDMNTQSSLWFVHSMQLFVWNGVHRRNMSPPEPCRPPLTRCHEPVRSGFPVESRGVGAFGSAGGGGPNCAATGVASRPRTIANMVAFIAVLTFQPLSARCPE